MGLSRRGEPPLFSVHGIRKYVRNLLIFSDVSFEVYKDELLGLVAPMGVTSDFEIDVIDSMLRPDFGTVRFKGADVTGLKLHKLASRGLVRTFQQPVVFEDMTVIDSMVTAHHLQYKKGWWTTIFRNDRETREATKSAVEILDSMDLLPLKDEKTKGLPYEQKRILGFAIALAARPELMILDQPPIELNVGGIDLIKRLARQVRSRGITVVMLGRAPGVLDDTCDRIASMSPGGASPGDASGWDDNSDTLSPPDRSGPKPPSDGDEASSFRPSSSSYRPPSG